MSKMFIGRFVASILALLIASSVLPTHGQSQSRVLSDEDKAEILEKLIQFEIKTHFSELVNIREIQGLKENNVVDDMVIRSISLRDGIVVVRLATVTVPPCYAPLVPRERLVSRERSVTYEFQKSPTGWVGKLVRTPITFDSARSLAKTP